MANLIHASWAQIVKTNLKLKFTKHSNTTVSNVVCSIWCSPAVTCSLLCRSACLASSSSLLSTSTWVKVTTRLARWAAFETCLKAAYKQYNKAVSFCICTCLTYTKTNRWKINRLICTVASINSIIIQDSQHTLILHQIQWIELHLCNEWTPVTAMYC